MKSPFYKVAEEKGVTGCYPHRDGLRPLLAESNKKSLRADTKHRTVRIEIVKAEEPEEGKEKDSETSH